MSQTPYPLQVQCNGKEIVGNSQVESYTTRGAFFLGLQMFVVTLFGAIFSIVLPGLHYITVPLGILASPFVGIYFFFTRKGAVKLTTGDFICPECQASNYVAFRGTPPYSSKCVQCQLDFKAAPKLGQNVPT